MHEEALEVLPELLNALDIKKPILIGHSDGASIALIHAAYHEITAVVAIAPHVFVEDMCLREIENARRAYLETDLRERMARHHRDPDAAFFGWNDVWLDPDFPHWDITSEVERITCPLLLIQGERDQYGTMAQLDAIAQRARGPVKRVHLDCMHSPPSELPNETVEAITAFLTEPNEPVHIVEEAFDTPVSDRLVADYVAAIKAMYPWWTPEVGPGMSARDVEPPHGRWLVAYRNGQRRRLWRAQADRRPERRDQADLRDARRTRQRRREGSPDPSGAGRTRSRVRVHPPRHRPEATGLGQAVQLERVRADRGLQRQPGGRVLVREAAGLTAPELFD